MSSNPVLHEYVAVSPTELPVDVTLPLLGLLGLEHKAEQTRKNNYYSLERVKCHSLTYHDKLVELA